MQNALGGRSILPVTFIYAHEVARRLQDAIGARRPRTRQNPHSTRATSSGARLVRRQAPHASSEISALSSLSKRDSDSGGMMPLVKPQETRSTRFRRSGCRGVSRRITAIRGFVATTSSPIGTAPMSRLILPSARSASNPINEPSAVGLLPLPGDQACPQQVSQRSPRALSESRSTPAPSSRRAASTAGTESRSRLLNSV